MPKVALTTLGCKVKLATTAASGYTSQVRNAGHIRNRGYEIVDFSEPADFYIINTCSVTHLGERKSRQLIRRANRLNDNAIIAVTGCYAQIASDEISKIEGVRVVIGTKQRDKIVDLVEKAAREDGLFNEVNDVMHMHEFEDIPLYGTPHRTRAFLKIQDGCCNFCSYCIIPYTRGPIRSRKLESIKTAVDQLVEENFHEIVFTGIHLGAYGRDFKGENISLSDAVEICLANENLKRLRLGSLESIEISPRLLELIKTHKRFTKHLHLPLQAGSDEILKAMNRHYTTAEFARLIENIRREVPDIAISTDIIVGFPGETDSQYTTLRNFVEKQRFDKVGIFSYSREEGTPAYDMPNQVDENIMQERYHDLMSLQSKISETINIEMEGKVLDVLIEGRDDEQHMAYGRSYREAPDVDGQVFIEGDDISQPGDIVKVRILQGFDYDVVGERVDA